MFEKFDNNKSINGNKSHLTIIDARLNQKNKVVKMLIFINIQTTAVYYLYV